MVWITGVRNFKGAFINCYIIWFVVNYKQRTIEKYLGLSNDNAHRASSDAKICGMILNHIINRIVNHITEKKYG